MTPCHNTAHQTLTNKNKTFNTKNLNQYEKKTYLCTIITKSIKQ